MHEHTCEIGLIILHLHLDFTLKSQRTFGVRDAWMDSLSLILQTKSYPGYFGGMQADHP